jgi:hypothetical protein
MPRHDTMKVNCPRAARLLELIAPFFLRDENSHEVEEISLFFSPKVIKIRQYREQYQSLKNFLGEHGIITKQIITDTRTY